MTTVEGGPPASPPSQQAGKVEHPTVAEPWAPTSLRREPVELLEEQARTRVPELVPIRETLHPTRHVSTGPEVPLAFHVMAKPTGATCNLDCEYCFFLSKEMLYPGSRFRMAERLQEAYIRQLLEGHARAPDVVVAWQGGEPTIMGLEFFRRSVELLREHARPGQRVLNTIQTNSILLDDEWGVFLQENDFLVGISIDGPREVHRC